MQARPEVGDRFKERQVPCLERALGIDEHGPALGIDGAFADAFVALAGSTAPERDAALIAEAMFGVMRRHARLSTAPTAAECDHAVGFCLRGLTRKP